MTFPVEQLHLGQLVLGDHALDQFLRAGGSGDQEIDEPRVVQQTLGDSLFQEGIAGDGVLAAGLQNADQGQRCVGTESRAGLSGHVIQNRFQLGGRVKAEAPPVFW